jgi:hypothetical protein
VEFESSSVIEVVSPRERLWPRKFIWAASLAFVIGGVAVLVPGLHGPVTGQSISEPMGETSTSVSALDSTWATQLTPARLSSATIAAKLTSFSVGQTSQARSSPSTSTSRLASLIVKRSTPIHLSIPAIGVSARLTVLGLNSNGSPQVPSSWYVPGWYKLGPSPGQLGSAVILGHVDSVAGPAVFYQLSSVKVGNRVIVKLADGKTVHFAVIGLREYLKSKFPDKYVYGPRPYSALQLVTCGGAFDTQTGHYLSSIVVFTKQVKS